MIVTVPMKRITELNRMVRWAKEQCNSKEWDCSWDKNGDWYFRFDGTSQGEITLFFKLKFGL